MPYLTPAERRRIVLLQGLNPDEYTINEDTGEILGKLYAPEYLSNVSPDIPQQENVSRLGSFLRGAGESVLPTIAGAATASGALALATPVSPVGALLLALGAGLAGAAAGSAVQHAVLPNEIQKSIFLRPEDIGQNPVSATLGSLAGSLPTFRPSPAALRATGRGLRSVITNLVAKEAVHIPAEDLGPLLNTVISGGAGAAISVGSDIASGQDISIKRALLEGLGNALLNEPTILGKGLGLHETPVSKRVPVEKRKGVSQDSLAARPETNPRRLLEEGTGPIILHERVPGEGELPLEGGSFEPAPKGKSLQVEEPVVTPEGEQLSFNFRKPRERKVPPDVQALPDEAPSEESWLAGRGLGVPKVKPQEVTQASTAFAQEKTWLKGRGLGIPERFQQVDESSETVASGALEKYRQIRAAIEQRMVRLGLHNLNDPRILEDFVELSHRFGVKPVVDAVHLIADGKPLQGRLMQRIGDDYFSAIISPHLADADTPAHEVLHAVIRQMQDSSEPSARAWIENALKTVEVSPEFAAAKEQFKAAGLYELDPTEWLTQRGGIDYLRRLVRADTRNPLKELYNDLRSMWRDRVGKATPEDLARILSHKLTYEAPFGERITSGMQVTPTGFLAVEDADKFYAQQGDPFNVPLFGNEIAPGITKEQFEAIREEMPGVNPEDLRRGLLLGPAREANQEFKLDKAPAQLDLDILRGKKSGIHTDGKLLAEKALTIDTASQYSTRTLQSYVAERLKKLLIGRVDYGQIRPHPIRGSEDAGKIALASKGFPFRITSTPNRETALHEMLHAYFEDATDRYGISAVMHHLSARWIASQKGLADIHPLEGTITNEDYAKKFLDLNPKTRVSLSSISILLKNQYSEYYNKRARFEIFTSLLTRGEAYLGARPLYPDNASFIAGVTQNTAYEGGIANSFMNSIGELLARLGTPNEPSVNRAIIGGAFKDIFGEDFVRLLRNDNFLYQHAPNVKPKLTSVVEKKEAYLAIVRELNELKRFPANDESLTKQQDLNEAIHQLLFSLTEKETAKLTTISTRFFQPHGNPFGLTEHRGTSFIDASPQQLDKLKHTSVKDSEGRPKATFHGTPHVFDPAHMNMHEQNNLVGPGGYFTEDPSQTINYATKRFPQDVIPGSILEEKRFPATVQGIDAAKQYEQGILAAHPKSATLPYQHRRATVRPVRVETVLEGKEVIMRVRENVDTRSPNILPAFLNIVHPFNADTGKVSATDFASTPFAKNLTPQKLELILGSLRYAPREGALAGYKQLVEALKVAEINEPKDATRRVLQELGYDGITHMGQNAPHRVWVAWDSSQVIPTFRGSVDTQGIDPRLGIPEGPIMGSPVGNPFGLNTGRPLLEERYGFIRGLEAQTDKARRIDPIWGPVIADATERWAARSSAYEGALRNFPIAEMHKKGFKAEEMTNAYQYLLDEKYNAAQPIVLTNREKHAVDWLRAQWANERQAQKATGMKVYDDDNIEYAVPDSIVPEILSEDAIHTFVHGTIGQQNTQFKEWTAEIVNRKGYTPAKADDIVRKYVANFTKAESTKGGYSVIRKLEPLPVPASLREMNIDKLLLRHGARVAKDLSYFQEAQSIPAIASLLHLPKPDGTGFAPIVPGAEPVNANKPVADLLKFLFNDFTSVKEQRITSTARIVTNMLLGPATGLRDTAQIPVFVLPYLHKFEDLKVFATALKDLSSARRDSLFYNARSGTMDRDRWRALENPDHVSEILNKVAWAFRKYQGRDLLEQGNRIYTFAIGRELAKLNLTRALSGDARSIKFIERFGTLIDIPLDQMSSNEINQIAKNFVDTVQGAYDARGLPTSAFEGALSPFLALSRWSLEKSNVLFKDVIKPAANGNYVPLLTYTMGTLLTGVGIQALNKLLTGRRPANATLGEAIEEKSPEDIVAGVVTLANLGSYLGVISDIARLATDVGLRGEVGRGASFPLASFVSETLGDNLSDFTRAIEEGAPFWETLMSLNLQIMKESVQGYRIIDNRLLHASDTERSNLFRDLRVFKRLEDEPTPKLGDVRVNPFTDPRRREFKRTDDPVRALELLPMIVQDAIRKSEGNGFKLRRELDSIKQNNFQIMPSPDSMPDSFVKYIAFLQKTQGEQAASERLVTYFRQRMLNETKRELVP